MWRSEDGSLKDEETMKFTALFRKASARLSAPSCLISFHERLSRVSVCVETDVSKKFPERNICTVLCRKLCARYCAPSSVILFAPRLSVVIVCME